MPNFGSGVMLGTTKVPNGDGSFSPPAVGLAGRHVAGRAVAGGEHQLAVGDVRRIAGRKVGGGELLRRGDDEEADHAHQDEDHQTDQNPPHARSPSDARSGA